MLNEHLINLRNEASVSGNKKKHPVMTEKEATMLTINPIKFNNIKPITFGEGNLNNITPNTAILSLQNPNAKINFENDLNRTKKSDVVQSQNMFSALGAKLRKTYNILFTTKYDCKAPTPGQLMYMA